MKYPKSLQVKLLRQIMMMKNKLLPAAFLIAQLSGAGFTQQPNPTPQSSPPPVQQSPTQKPDDVDVVRITTNLVQVDAMITDRNGKPVADLKPEEVEIFEDGRKQKITHFSFNLAETPVTERPAKPAVAE